MLHLRGILLLDGIVLQLGLLFEGIFTKADKRLIPWEFGATDEASVLWGGMVVDGIAALVDFHGLPVVLVLLRRLFEAGLRGHIDALDVLLHIFVQLRGVSFMEPVGSVVRVLSMKSGICLHETLLIL